MNEKKTTINNYTITISTYLSSIPTQNNCWNSLTIIASLDLLHFIKEKLDWHYLDYLWCLVFWRLALGETIMFFLILNDELIEKLAIIKRNWNVISKKCPLFFLIFFLALYFCCKVGRQQQQRTANPEIDNCVISCNGWVALLPK